MFRIGLIDYYLDEWHAQNYPTMLREEIARQGLSMEVKMAYAYCDKEDGMSNEEWSKKQNVPLASSMDELIANCDGVMILAPSFPEKHYEMAEKALRAGKPVYMDKIFAPSEEEGRKIFVFGHPEYDRITLEKEYLRDKHKGLDIQLPKNYFPGDNCEERPLLMWRAHANTLYTNWINYYVYQLTPYMWEDEE